MQDILLNPAVDQLPGNDDVTTVLPANERNQGRWNGDPHSINDGGDGMTEMDAGAWLLPYWMARAFDVLAAA